MTKMRNVKTVYKEFKMQCIMIIVKKEIYILKFYLYTYTYLLALQRN